MTTPKPTSQQRHLRRFERCVQLEYAVRQSAYFFSLAADEKNKEDAHQRVFLCELRTNKLGLSKKTLLCLDGCKRVWRRIAIGLSFFSYCTLASIRLCFFFGGSDLVVFCEFGKCQNLTFKPIFNVNHHLNLYVRILIHTYLITSTFEALYF